VSVAASVSECECESVGVGERLSVSECVREREIVSVFECVLCECVSVSECQSVNVSECVCHCVIERM
jgi:hypothetical protein